MKRKTPKSIEARPKTVKNALNKSVGAIRVGPRPEKVPTKKSARLRIRIGDSRNAQEVESQATSHSRKRSNSHR